MINNFDNFDDKRYKKEEYEKAFFDLFSDAIMNLFENLKRKAPDLAQRIKPDYDEFMNILLEYFKDKKTLIGIFGYALSKNKNNLWTEFLIDFIEKSIIMELEKNPNSPILKGKPSNELIKEMRRIIMRKRRGKDIQ